MMKMKNMIRRLCAMLTVLLLVSAFVTPVFAERVNTKDDPNSSEYYDGVYYDDEAWKTRPFHAYWSDESCTKNAIDGSGTIYALMNVYYAGEGKNYTGLQTIMAVRVWTNKDWKIQLKSEKTGTSTDKLVYTARVQTGDKINVAGYNIRMMNGNAISKQNRDVWMAKNDPNYQSEWAFAPIETFAFYTNIRAVHRNGSWIDGAEDFVWPDESGDAVISSWEYTVQPGDELIYADIYAKSHLSNHWTGEEKTVVFTYRFEFTVSDSGYTPSSGKTQNVTDPAKNTPGEDSGTEILPEILISIGGAVAAAGALGAASGGGNDGGKKDKDKEEEKKRYKMYIYKAFGDAVQKGAPPVKVYARISQIIDGKEYDCPEQTEKITVSGENMNVRAAGKEGAYIAAEISAEKDSAFDQGTLTFTLKGPGGVVNRSIIFRLVGEPRIAFPKELEGGKWDLSVSLNKVDMIAGLGGKERLRFAIIDAVEEPRSIEFRNTDGFIIDYEPDSKYAFTYHALIDNKTDRIEKAAGIFAEKEERWITVEAVFENGMRIQNYFCVDLYPDGLAVLPEKDHVVGDRLIIDTAEDPNAGAGHAKIRPVAFDFTVCYMDDLKGESVILKNPTFDHGDPDDGGKYDHLFKDNFEYKLSHLGTAGIMFFPLNTLPYLGKPYEASMRLIYDGDGQHFEEDMPLGVTGEKPPKPSEAELQRAISWLMRDIRTFGIGSDPQLKEMLQHVNEMSAAQVDYIRKSIIEAGTSFYNDYGKAYNEFGELMTKYIVVAGTLVKAMDYALEYVMKLQWGPYGGIAAKFVNPMKNLMGTYIGEYIANGNLEGAPDFIETALKSSEDALAQAITGAFFDDSIMSGINVSHFGKKFSHPPIADQLKEIIGYLIATYLLTCFIRHYNYGTKGEKGDIYRSCVAACCDLGYESLKAWFLSFLMDRCKWLFQKIGEGVGKIWKSCCQKEIGEMAAKSGQKAFDDGLRLGFKTDLRGLTQESLNAARAARDAAANETKTIQNEMLDNAIKALGQGGKTVGEWLADSPVIGGILNYMAQGTSRENELYGGTANDALGLTASEVIVGYITDRLGVKLGKVYESGIMNPLEVTLRVENGNIILGMLGHNAEINIMENIDTLAEFVFDTLTSWMNDLLKSAKELLDYSSIQDLRDKPRTDVDTIRKDLEEMKRRCEGYKATV